MNLSNGWNDEYTYLLNNRDIGCRRQLADFNTFLSKIDETIIQKISKNIKPLHSSRDQCVLTDSYGALPTNNRMSIFLQCTRNVYKDYPYAGYKERLNKLKLIQNIQSLYSAQMELARKSII